MPGDQPGADASLALARALWDTSGPRLGGRATTESVACPEHLARAQKMSPDILDNLKKSPDTRSDPIKRSTFS